MSRRGRQRWTRGEKTILVGVIVALAGGSGFVEWSRWGNADPDVRVPAVVLPSPNGFDYYFAAGRQVIARGKIVRAVLMGSPPTSAALSVVAANRPGIAVAKSGMRYPYVLPQTAQDSGTFISSFVRIVRAIQLEATVDGVQGRWYDAANDDLDDLEITQDIAQSGGVIGSLVGLDDRNGTIKLAAGTVGHISARQCEALIQRLEAIDDEERPFADIVAEERIEMRRDLIRSMKSPSWQANLYGANGVRIRSAAELGRRMRGWMTSKRAFIEHFEAFSDAEAKAAPLPYSTYMARPKINDAMLQDGYDHELRQCRKDRTVARAEVRLLMTRLALRAYRLDHATYPTRLTALAPKYLRATPVDPFDEQPLRYRSASKTYLLYSIGPDLMDDRGKPVRAKNEFQEIDDNAHGDIVAGVNGY